MNSGRVTAGIARVVVAVTGVALIVAGADAISAWAGIDLHERWSIHLDRRWWFALPAQGWWSWALTGTAVVLVLVGLVIIAAVLRPRRAPEIALRSTDLGRLAVAPDALAQGVIADLEAAEQTESATARCRIVRGKPTITVQVHSTTEVDLDALRNRMGTAVENLAATAGPHAPDIRFLLHLSRIPRSDSRVV